jgi:hypothetical protein
MEGQNNNSYIVNIVIVVIIGGMILGIAYLIISKIIDGIGKGVSSSLGLDVLEEKKKQLAELIKKKKEFIENIKIEPKGKISIGKNIDDAKSKANGIATMLFNNMEGINDTTDNAVIKNIIMDKLPYKNDVRLVFKAFGLRSNQNLADWIGNEDMPKDWKNTMISKIATFLK